MDEGPSPSGPSVLAVADALRGAGITRIHVFSSPETTFGAELLPEALWQALPTGREDALARTTLCGGGAWRSVHYANPGDWPAVCRTFEQTKFVCEGASGRRILFKFAGLATVPGSRSSGAEVQSRRLERLAQAGFTSPPCGTAHGFVATEWLEGRPLTPSDSAAPRDDGIKEVGKRFRKPIASTPRHELHPAVDVPTKDEKRATGSSQGVAHCGEIGFAVDQKRRTIGVLDPPAVTPGEQQRRTRVGRTGGRFACGARGEGLAKQGISSQPGGISLSPTARRRSVGVVRHAPGARGKIPGHFR